MIANVREADQFLEVDQLSIGFTEELFLVFLLSESCQGFGLKE
jgi:hypothetical protein